MGDVSYLTMTETNLLNKTKRRVRRKHGKKTQGKKSEWVSPIERLWGPFEVFFGSKELIN